jgi:hypothetical protein
MTKQFEVEIRGIAPLLMNSNRGVNPLEPLVKEMKNITAKGSKKMTDDDQERLLHIKWLLGMYFDDNLGPYVPSMNVEATIRNAAKQIRRGKDTGFGLQVSPDRIPVIYEGPRTKEELWDDKKFSDFSVGKMKTGSSVNLCRPRFDMWSLKFKIIYDEKVFNDSTIKELLVIGGHKIGLCDWRPSHGRFEIINISPVKEK